MKRAETPEQQVRRMKALAAEERVKSLFARCIHNAQLAFLIEYICGEDHPPSDRELHVASHIIIIVYNLAVRDMQNRMDLMPHIYGERRCTPTPQKYLQGSSIISKRK